MTDEATTELVLRVSGEVVENNFDEYRDMILAKIDTVDMNPETEEEISDAEKIIKTFAKAKKMVDTARENAMSETSDIRDVFESLGIVSDRLKEVLRDLRKAVRISKEKQRSDVVADVINVLEEKIRGLYRDYPCVPVGTFHIVPVQLSDAGKGKHKTDTYRKAVEAKASEILEGFNEIADLCEQNNERLERVGNKALFPDINSLVKLPKAELEAIIESRVAKFELQLEQEKKQEPDNTPPVHRAKTAQETSGPAGIPRFRQPDHEPATKQEQPGTSEEWHVVEGKGNNQPQDQPEVSEEGIVAGSQEDRDLQEEAANAVKEATFFRMNVLFSGDVEKIKDIAREVDGVVSKYQEVVKISLVKCELAAEK